MSHFSFLASPLAILTDLVFLNCGVASFFPFILATTWSSSLPPKPLFKSSYEWPCPFPALHQPSLWTPVVSRLYPVTLCLALFLQTVFSHWQLIQPLLDPHPHSSSTHLHKSISLAILESPPGGHTLLHSSGPRSAEATLPFS